MSKSSLSFKIISTICLIIDIMVAIFFIGTLISVFINFSILGSLHFAILIIAMAIIMDTTAEPDTKSAAHGAASF